MKILVVQLARLGDIYQTWPAIRALRRTFPRATIDLLVRDRFSEATHGLKEIDEVLSLETSKILEPCFSNEVNLDQVKKNMSAFLSGISCRNYDRIINLSFSVFSSYLTYHLSEFSSKPVGVQGYSRHRDGTLCLPDGGSLYFYSQIGALKENRIHIVNLFSHVAGVELTPEDRYFSMTKSEVIERLSLNPKKYICFHMGASHKNKTYPKERWLSVANLMMDRSDLQIVLIGSSSEKDMGNYLTEFTINPRCVDLIGKTSLTELMEIIDNSYCLVGGDSSPLQIASLLNIPALNLSFSSVNFWETGPISTGSRVLLSNTPEELASDRVALELEKLVNGEDASKETYTYVDKISSFKKQEEGSSHSFQWGLIQALYMEKDFPIANESFFLRSCSELQEVNRIILQQIDRIKKDDISSVVSIMEAAEEVVDAIRVISPDVRPIVDWYRGYKVMIGPKNVDSIIEETLEVHLKLDEVLSLYTDKSFSQNRSIHDSEKLG